MFKVHDFVCADGHVTEVFSKGQSPEHIDCDVCGKQAVKQLSAPRSKLEGITGDFPGAAAKWDQKHAEKLKEEKKQLKEHGSLSRPW